MTPAPPPREPADWLIDFLDSISSGPDGEMSDEEMRAFARLRRLVVKDPQKMADTLLHAIRRVPAMWHERVWTVEELASRLGISEAVIEAAARSGRLTGCKRPDGSWWFSQEDLDRLVGEVQ